MIRRPPISTRTDTLFPYATLFRSFSCSNQPFGWFNAYAHAAARNDIDLVGHVGDYLYEYQVGNYPSLKQALPGRDIQRSEERRVGKECVSTCRSRWSQ